MVSDKIDSDKMDSDKIASDKTDSDETDSDETDSDETDSDAVDVDTAAGAGRQPWQWGRRAAKGKAGAVWIWLAAALWLHTGHLSRERPLLCVCVDLAGAARNGGRLNH